MMFDLTNQKIENTGWSGPLFWIVTDLGASIHLFDSELNLKSREVLIGEDLNPEVKGVRISRITITPESFSIVLQSGEILSVNSEQHETARVFKKGSCDLHHIYQNGVFSQES